MSRPPRDQGISRRRAARFAAIQALYQIEVDGADPAVVTREFLEHRLPAILEPLEEELPSPRVDKEWFELLVKGASAARERLDAAIVPALAEGWTLARCGFLLRAVLRAGSFELAEKTDVPVKVVINEYVELAHLFFTNGEPSFVNAVLDRLAGQLRDPEAAL